MTNIVLIILSNMENYRIIRYLYDLAVAAYISILTGENTQDIHRWRKTCSTISKIRAALNRCFLLLHIKLRLLFLVYMVST